jgi:short-subunit dehydrogenase
MKRDLAGKRILITGASSGIGRALAEEAAAQGARVAIMARSTEKLDELARTLTAQGKDVLAVPGDVTVEADRQRVLRRVEEHFGGLDVLINNAGIGSHGHFADSTEEILRQVMEVNFFAPAELTRLAIPLLSQGNQPAIVNVSSMCGRCGMPAWPEYSASKAALCGLSESLRGEMLRYGIDVLLIVPGLTATNLKEHLLRRDGRMVIKFEKGMPPPEVAQRILKALRNNRRETVLGWEAVWMIRMHRWLPRFLCWGLSRYVRKLWAKAPQPQGNACPGAWR